MWGIWSEWGTCSKTCGNGTKTRNRTKLVVEDVTGACNGTSMESDSCNPIACPGKIIVTNYQKVKKLSYLKILINFNKILNADFLCNFQR